MGRPMTPSPEGGGDSERGKAGSALWMVLIGMVSLVLAIVSIAVPRWGTYAPQSSPFSGGSRSRFAGYEGAGFFGPFQECSYRSGGLDSNCDSFAQGNAAFRTEVYMKIAGACAIVEVVTLALFTMFAGLHCAMQVNNKHMMLKYKKNIFGALISIIIADLGAIGAVILAAIQLNGRSSPQHTLSVGACFILQIILIILNLLLIVLTYLNYRKARKSNFPLNRSPYEITSDRYEVPANGGIAVTHESGNAYPVPQQPPMHLQPPSYNHNNQQPYTQPHAQVFQGPYINNQPNGHSNNGYNGSLPPMTGPPYTVTGQLAQPQVQARPMPPSRDGLSLNPEGRGVSYNKPTGHHGSMESLDSTQSSINSFGSTGSYSSNISNPMRSSLKKPKKENSSVASGVSKKSVTIAIGAEQTAV